MEFNELIAKAKSVLGNRRLSEDSSAGGVAAALLTEAGNVYLGVCIDTPCGMGFCAEHAAIAAMVTAGECRIHKIVAVWEGDGGVVIPPCGRCREFISQMHKDNMDTRVMAADGSVVTIRELLPYDMRV